MDVSLSNSASSNLYTFDTLVTGMVNLEDLVDFGAGVIGDSVQSQNISFSRSPLTIKQKLLLRLGDVCFCNIFFSERHLPPR